MMRVLILHGPNLDLLGVREPGKYGSLGLAQITARLDQLASQLGASLEHHQSPHEGELVARVHQAMREGLHGAVVNAGAYTHTSIALRDAFLATRLPFVEVHISNVAAREPFRHHSYLSDVALGVVGGLGPQVYELGLRGLCAVLTNDEAARVLPGSDGG